MTNRRIRYGGIRQDQRAAVAFGWVALLAYLFIAAGNVLSLCRVRSGLPTVVSSFRGMKVGQRNASFRYEVSLANRSTVHVPPRHLGSLISFKKEVVCPLSIIQSPCPGH